MRTPRQTRLSDIVRVTQLASNLRPDLNSGRQVYPLGHIAALSLTFPPSTPGLKVNTLSMREVASCCLFHVALGLWPVGNSASQNSCNPRKMKRLWQIDANRYLERKRLRTGILAENNLDKKHQSSVSGPSLPD